MDFKLVSEFQPTGDQPQAIEALTNSIESGQKKIVLMGVTGSGKTFTMANVINKINRPILVLSHNKTLAAQLYNEFCNFFPQNAVEYFVSYYDYYQPEAFIPSSNTYIEKDLSINEEIEKMRLSTTSSLLSGRRDIIVVSSVSCLYGIGNPADFHDTAIDIKVGEVVGRKKFLYNLVDALYTRTELELTNGTFKVRGETIDIMPAFGTSAYRIGFFDDEIESITLIDPPTGQKINAQERITIYPANLFVTTKERAKKAISQIQIDLGLQIEFFEQMGRPQEASRIKQRVEYDLEMIKELGYCSGIENYSRYFDGRKPGSRPFCLLDYFADDYIVFVDESHVTLPQIRAMWGGDASRKKNLIEYGYRLPAASDNRPLTFSEFEELAERTIYVSATPADYELYKSEGEVIEQVIRPTSILDPIISIRPIENQIEDLIEEINTRSQKDEKILVTTLTKHMAEELSKYLNNLSIKNRYIHSDIDTLERITILEGLREGLYDVLIGVNLLREGLDLPEVSLVAILDADKEGFLRNTRSLTQTAGRAARHPNGMVIMYANKKTDSINQVVAQSTRRRQIQMEYNKKHNKVPRLAIKNSNKQNLEAHDTDLVNYSIANNSSQKAAENQSLYTTNSTSDIKASIETLTTMMNTAAKELDFITAARYRDAIQRIKEENKLLQK